MPSVEEKHRKQIGRIRRFLEGIEWLFELNNYQRHFTIKEKDHDEYRDLAAEITFDEKYQNVVVTIYPNFFTLQPYHQRKALLHELCHAITIPSQKVALDLLRGTAATENQIRDINKKTTSRLENLFNGLLTSRYKYARRAYSDFLAKPKKHPKRTKRHVKGKKQARVR